MAKGAVKRARQQGSSEPVGPLLERKPSPILLKLDEVKQSTLKSLIKTRKKLRDAIKVVQLAAMYSDDDAFVEEMDEAVKKHQYTLEKVCMCIRLLESDRNLSVFRIEEE